ncbi:MAG TPA: (Fe-S)-binding protein [Deltaproteobacteria bacterium]|nr:(Fe-S)-binding protein [Deltaproteobacteria bacterium]
MYPIAVGLLLLAGLAFFSYTIHSRIALLKMAKGQAWRFEKVTERVKALFTYAIGQRRMMQIKKDFWPGLWHAFIFWGFCVLSIRTITLFGQGFSPHFHLPGLSGTLGNIYNLNKDIFTVLVFIACIYFLGRRFFTLPKRISLSLEGILILLTIMSLMVTDWFYDGGRIALGHEAIDPLWGPMGVATAKFIAWLGWSPGATHAVSVSSYFLHLALILGFLNFLPYGKHFHIITSLPNVFMRNLKPYGALNPINLEDESATTFGIDKINEFSWKDVMDMYTCTECGRCTSHCPAYNTDKPLNPKQFLMEMKEFVVHHSADIVEGTEEQREAVLGKSLVPNVIDPEILWSCTTCRACEEACPVFIEYVQKIVDMRRHLVLMRGEFPAEAQATLRNIENNGNPWGIGMDERATWAKGLGIPSLAEKPEVEVLYWVGCAGSFDDRNKKVSSAVVKILQEAKIDFAILGPEETCTGDPARRIGNEYLFQTLAKQNIETMGRYKFKTVLAQCPHCFNTIKNEYPQFGGHYEVIHHTDFIARLIEQGKIKPVKDLNEKLTYHDSCYLGRYNNVYESPREVLKQIPGVSYQDADLSKATGRCCGAGGGRMWMEERLGERVNHKRLDDLMTVEPQTIAAACPFCMTMLTDAARDKHIEIKTKDVAELVAESLG